MFTHLSPHSALHLCFIFCGQRTGKYRQPKGVCAISTDFCLRFKHWDYILGGQKREGEEKLRCIDSKKFLYALALDYFLKRHWNSGTILAGNNGTVKQSVGVCSVNFVKENYDKNIFINDLNTNINMQYCWQYIGSKIKKNYRKLPKSQNFFLNWQKKRQNIIDLVFFLMQQFCFLHQQHTVSTVWTWWVCARGRETEKVRVSVICWCVCVCVWAHACRRLSVSVASVSYMRGDADLKLWGEYLLYNTYVSARLQVYLKQQYKLQSNTSEAK